MSTRNVKSDEDEVSRRPGVGDSDEHVSPCIGTGAERLFRSSTPGVVDDCMMALLFDNCQSMSY